MDSTTVGDITADTVYQQIRSDIIRGHHPPGTRLIEGRLAQELGVSRTPVRQAIARAAAEGLLQTFPNRGAVVRTYSRTDLMQLYDLRAVLEGFAAFQAATRITQAQLAHLEQQAIALEKAAEQPFATREEEVQFLVTHNRHFHNAVVEASRNQHLADLVNRVVAVPLQFRSFNWYSAEERRISNFFHRSILHALKRGEADRARAVMQEHIYFGRDHLLKFIKDHPEKAERSGETI